VQQLRATTLAIVLQPNIDNRATVAVLPHSYLQSQNAQLLQQLLLIIIIMQQLLL
jgi:hypothetical protein